MSGNVGYWYFGEVACRHRGARWKYHVDELGYAITGDGYANRRYVDQSDPEGHAAVPIATLKAAVRIGEPGVLRDRFARFR